MYRGIIGRNNKTKVIFLKECPDNMTTKENFNQSISLKYSSSTFLSTEALIGTSNRSHIYLAGVNNWSMHCMLRLEVVPYDLKEKNSNQLF